MMAIVTSRGFANLGYDGVDALVPMLDLLDHTRGGAKGGVAERDSGAIQERDSTNCSRIMDGGGIGREEEVGSTESDGGTSTEKYRNGSSSSDVARLDWLAVGTTPSVGPDVRYARFDEDDKDRISNTGEEDGSASKRQRTDMDESCFTPRGCRRGGRGGVRVTTARSLRPGSTLQMTYGAKGNATLLGRYGFCIPNNIEPDGE